MSFALRNSDSPPSSRMPTSNETRVRVDDLENISAHVWPASGCVEPRPLALEHDRVAQDFFQIRAGNFSNDNRCFMSQILGIFRPKKILTNCGPRRHFFFFASFAASAARQRYHAAVVRCGFHFSPNASSSFGFGISRFL
jgi:hypothetical protein